MVIGVSTLSLGILTFIVGVLALATGIHYHRKALSRTKDDGPGESTPLIGKEKHTKMAKEKKVEPDDKPL